MSKAACGADDYTTHPVADIWPLLPEAELAALAEDIRENGLRYPIWRHRDGRIVDGRNRWLACRRVGVACPHETYRGADGVELVAFVVGLNERRRHLTESQRAAVAAELPARGRGRPSAAEKAHGCAFSDAEAAGLLGVSERAVEYAKAVRRADLALHERVRQGELSLAEARRALDEGKVLPHAVCTGAVEWYTPAPLVEAVREAVGGIDLDPASCARAQETVRAARYFTEADDGLAQAWHGRVFLNPPYARDLIGPFVDKLLDEIAAGNVAEAVLLTDSCTETKWWQRAGERAAAVSFPARRIGFTRGDGTGENPVKGSSLLYFGPAPARFAATFAALGLVFPGPVPVGSAARADLLEAAE